MSDFNFDDIFETHAPKPAADPLPIAPVPTQPPSHPATKGSGSGWVIGILSFTTFLFAILWIMAIIPDGIIPSPGPTPGPDKGTYALIVYDDQAKADYTDEQRTAIDSAAIADFLTTEVDDWKKVDKDQLDELANLDPAYAPMAEQHMSALPWIVVRKDGRNKGSELIEDPEQLIELVKRSVK
jgi:hypothetical protein